MGAFLSKKKIANKIKTRSGMGSIVTILGAAVAAALIAFPLARWQMSFSQKIATDTQSLQNMDTEIEARTMLEERWRQINDMNIDEFNILPDKWSKKSATKYEKYLIWEKFGATGRFNPANGQCEEGTPDAEHRACKIATLQATDLDGSKVYAKVTSIRVAPITINDNPVIEEWHDGRNWYKKYKNGWCEQGGVEPISYNYASYRQNIKLHVTMRDDKYSILVSPVYRHGSIRLGAGLYGYGVLYNAIQNTTTFQVLVYEPQYTHTNWRAEGFYK